MKKVLFAVLASLILLTACNDGDKKVSEGDLKTQADSAAYVMAHNMAMNMKMQGHDFNNDIFATSLKNALEGEENFISPEASQKVMNAYFAEISKKKADKDNLEAKTNLDEGAKFLEKNRKEDGVIETASGLQYKVITKGNGPKPKPSDKVTVHYEGSTLDGTVFDSSYKRDKPTTFGVTQVIKGWIEGLQLMNVGSKYKLYIPANLAYGPKRRSPEIGPNQLLIFTIELIEIEGGAKPNRAN